jgi:hypothetical protein
MSAAMPANARLAPIIQNAGTPLVRLTERAARRFWTEIFVSRQHGQVALTTQVHWFTFPNDIQVSTTSGH